MSAIDFIKRHEGYRNTPYKCTAGYKSVFYGRNYETMGFSVDELDLILSNLKDNELTIEIANRTLKHDMEWAYSALNHIFADFSEFSEKRRDALVSIMYNLGVKRFNGFKKMIAAIHNNDWIEAGLQLQDSKRHEQITNRSEEEATMLMNG